VLHYARLERLARHKHSSLLLPFMTYKWGLISQSVTINKAVKLLPGTNTVAYWSHSYLTNGPNKLECYIELGWNGLPNTNIVANWSSSQFNTAPIKL
jgi:hypothetical protein